jgi:hypothetical protein
MTGNTPKPITDAELEARIRSAFGSPIEGTHQVIRVDRGRDPSADDLFWEFQHHIDSDREYQFAVEREIEQAQEIMWRIAIATGLFMAVVVIVAAFWK